jgi:hypothetical protein
MEPAVMGLSHQTRVGVALAAAMILPLASAVALVPLRSSIPAATVALALAAVVTLLSATGTRGTAALAAISASVGFEVFHTRPYGSLAITRAQDIETTVLLLVVGLIVGQLAAVNRRHRSLADESSDDLSRIHAVAEMVAAGEPADQVVLAVANELTDLLGLRFCQFDPSFADRPGPFIERHGDVSWGAIRWGYRTMGFPTKEVSLLVEHQSRPLGRFVLEAQRGSRVTTDQLLVAVALADQAGSALAAQIRPR